MNLVTMLGVTDLEDGEVTFDNSLRDWLKSLSSVSFQYVMSLKTSDLRGINTLPKEEQEQVWANLAVTLNQTAVRPPDFLGMGTVWDSRNAFVIFANLARVLNWQTYLNTP